MAILPITYNINDDIFVELLPVFQTHSDDLVDHNWIVGIYMENGSHYGFGHLRAIQTRTGISLSGRKSDLVIRNYMDYPSRSVAFQILELVGFVNNT